MDVGAAQIMHEYSDSDTTILHHNILDKDMPLNEITSGVECTEYHFMRTLGYVMEYGSTEDRDEVSKALMKPIRKELTSENTYLFY